MTILYALVARGTTVLAEYMSARSSNVPTVTRLVLAKVDPHTDAKMSLTYGAGGGAGGGGSAGGDDSYIFHYAVSDGVVYLCLTDAAAGSNRRVPFAFLADIEERFRRAFGDRVHSAIAFAMNAEFSRVMNDRMDYFNDPASGADKFSALREKITDVKGVMTQNIERVLERGEKIELLVDKTEQLSVSAQRFQKQSKNLKDAMWWRNCKMWALIIVVALLVIYIIVGLACGFTFQKCK